MLSLIADFEEFLGFASRQERNVALTQCTQARRVLTAEFWLGLNRHEARECPESLPTMRETVFFVLRQRGGSV